MKKLRFTGSLRKFEGAADPTCVCMTSVDLMVKMDGGHLESELTVEGIGAASKVVAANLGVPHPNHWDSQSFGYGVR